jgi:uncharacterized protein (DUF697 family)
VARLAGIGNVWNVVREINVAEIKEQAEQPIRIALIGASEPRHAVVQALYGQEQRFRGDYMAIEEYELPLSREGAPSLHRSDLALLVVDGRYSSDADVAVAADQIEIAGVPTVALLVAGSQGMARLSSLRRVPSATVVQVSDLEAATLAKRLVPELVDRLPEDQRIAAARVVPLLRDAVARRLINDTSMSNATYALTSGIPEMIPLLNIALNAADIVVLTKNQALLVYKLALAYGAPSDFQNQMREVLPVIGGGFLWRQVARQLVGLIPVLGIAPKVVVAYAGTYATGQAALRWYRNSEILSQPALRKLYTQAITIGRQRAAELVQQRKPDGAAIAQKPQRRWFLRRLLGQKKHNEQDPNDKG